MHVQAVNQATNLTLKIAVVVEPDENRFHAYCPAFKGLHVDGDSEQEALQNAQEAAVVYLNSLAANEEAIPIGPHCERVEHEHCPAGALMRDVEVSWPSHKRYGTK